MGTYAPLVADLFLFCYEGDFMLSLSKHADVVEVLNSTSRYLDDLLNVDNPYFEQMVSQIYLTELQAPFLECPLFGFGFINDK